MKTDSSNHRTQGKGLTSLLDIIVLILSVVLVVDISVDTLQNIPFYTQSEFMKIQFGVCISFLAIFFIELSTAKDKKRFFIHHFIFLLVAIPYHAIFSLFGWTSSPEVSYLFRFVPLIRGGYALAIIAGWFTKNKITGLFVAYLMILLISIYFGSLAFYYSEFNLNPLVKGYSDAIWWAFMDATTVGSNIIAVTPLGKVLSVMLAAVGMMMFPIFTVYITTLVERKNKEQTQ